MTKFNFFLFIPLGLLFLGKGAFPLIKNWDFFKTAQHAQGTVIEVISTDTDEGNHLVFVVAGVIIFLSLRKRSPELENS